VQPTPFDRLSGYRKYRKLKYLFLSLSGLGVLALTIFLLDPVLNQSPVPLIPSFIAGGFTIISFGLAWYFHMQYLSSRGTG
jgi:hypothetical protein